ncbi:MULTISPECIES: hypothetical protein [Spirulina sp. CCY15215]|uniref:hypothetical protein n=1 Tax=Spirulina sp. CCY15215 TaxID=2767591 RepID=UPI00194F4C94|nr:hypothetical protein [Spirulina major]
MFDISPKNHQTRSHFLPKKIPIKRRDRFFYSSESERSHFLLFIPQDDTIVKQSDRIPFVIVLYQGDRKIDEQVVDLMFADAYFDNLKPGKYTALVKHELVEPIEARYEFEIMTDSELSLILFNYLEPERVLLRINTIIAEK